MEKFVTGILHIVLARKPIEGTIAENCSAARFFFNITEQESDE